VRLLLGAVLLALALVLRGEARARFLVPLSGLFLASVALTGHAKAEPGAAGWIHVLADALHLPAAGAWLGALVPLGWLATRRPGSAATAEAMRRFGGVGSAAVATLLLTGLVNAWFLMGTPGKLVTTLYGRLLGVKLLLFLGMLALATLNRFRLVPALVEDPGAIRRLRAHVVGEQVLGLAVVAVVALLGTIDPSA
jgi:putative copper resistance protein D